MRARWAIAPMIAVALLAYAQVLSGAGLIIWVLPAAAIAWAATGAVRLLLPGTAGAVLAWPVLAVTTAGWAGLVKLLAGTASGPVTRSSLIVGALVGAMCIVQHTRARSVALIPGVLLLGGALALGADEWLAPLAALFAAAAAWALVALGPYRRADLRSRPRVVAIGAVVLLATATALAGTALASTVLSSPWQLPGAAANNAPSPSASPSPTVSPSPSPTPSATASPTASSVPQDPFETIGSDVISGLRDTVLPALRNVAVAVLVLLALWLLLQLCWRAWVTTRWIAARRRLAQGSPRDRVLGAWAWARLRLDQAGFQLPPSASPDVVASGGQIGEVPLGLTKELAKLASIAAEAGFSADDGHPLDGREEQRASVRAWSLAREVESRLRRARRPQQWWTVTARRPDPWALRELPDAESVATSS